MEVAANPAVRLPFADRAEAGRLLAARLAGRNLSCPLVLALPRGGVAVGYEVARGIGAPLDVYVTRKIGYPYQPELGVGALAEDGEPVYDHELLRRLGMTPGGLADTLARERLELSRRVRVYRGDRPAPEVGGRHVVVVDDGLATGVTARAALRALRTRRPAGLLLAVPVGAPETVADLRAEADDLVVLATPAEFRAVGQWYRCFDQLTDADVVRLLELAGTRGQTA